MFRIARFFVVLLMILSSPGVFATLVKAQLAAGLVRVELPRYHQGIVLDNATISVRYLHSDAGPPPFPYELIVVNGEFRSGGNLNILMHGGEACEDSTESLRKDAVWEGRRCLDWSEDLYLIVDFTAVFEGVEPDRGREFLAQSYITLYGQPNITTSLVEGEIR
ncbi:hypothetical protein [Lysobacter sp. H23M47]|uniref:hypothetical protein n=1 Tax=Lysobacter sp. H23M47 TaxID=2781024 RepID=UPI001880261D|nr:hypothetical protein [Lysobacter sp. H23M47]QOW24503.1 hypothetical protein INQ43_12645 [Lysobacter sp. H23M47]